MIECIDVVIGAACDVAGPIRATWIQGVVGMAWSNGAGKSTMLRSMLGLLAVRRGVLRVAGADPARDPHEVRRCIGWLPDRLEVPEDATGADLLGLACWARGVPRAAALRECDRFAIGSILQAPLSSCSLGQRRRIQLAVSLIGAPPVLLLDEPTVGLDSEGIDRLTQAILARGPALTVVASHDHGWLDQVRAVRWPTPSVPVGA